MILIKNIFLIVLTSLAMTSHSAAQNPTSITWWQEGGSYTHYYPSGQAACDARQQQLNWPAHYLPLLFYMPSYGDGIYGECRDAYNRLAGYATLFKIP